MQGPLSRFVFGEGRHCQGRAWNVAQLQWPPRVRMSEDNKRRERRTFFLQSRSQREASLMMAVRTPCESVQVNEGRGNEKSYR